MGKTKYFKKKEELLKKIEKENNEINSIKDYNKFFGFLQKKFPTWIFGEELLKKTNIDKENIESLSRDGFLQVKCFESKKDKQYLKVFDWDSNTDNEFFIGGKEGKLFRLSHKSFEYLNNLSLKEMNRRLMRFSEILIWLSIALIFIGIVQILAIIIQTY
ncbi:hypothetical protein ES703_97781 [subsurface metagenome]